MEIDVKKEESVQDVRVAFLGVDNVNFKPLEDSLKNVFEKFVVGAGWFNWGHRLPNEYDRNRNNHYDRNMEEDGSSLINFRIPAEVAITTSILIEQVANVAAERLNDQSVQWADRTKSFSIALYEIVDGKVGRIKVLEKCSFYNSSLGGGAIYEQNNQPFPGNPLSGGPQTENLSVAGMGVLVKPELRAMLNQRIGKTRAK